MIDLDDYFIDKGGDVLSYEIAYSDTLDFYFDETTNELTIYATDDWDGEEDLSVTASDGTSTVGTTIPLAAKGITSNPITDVFPLWSLIALVSAAIISTIVVAVIYFVQRD